LITSFSSSSSIFAGESGAQAERVEVAPDPDRMMLLLPCRPLPPDCESAGAAWLQVNPCGDAAVCPDTRVGRENQLARMWALDGARHTSEIASWRFVSRGVMGVHRVMVMGVVGSGYVLSRLAPVSGVGPGGSSPHL